MDYNLRNFKKFIKNSKNISAISGLVNPKNLPWKGVFRKPKWRPNNSYNTYEICSDKVTVPLINFITGVNPTKSLHKGGEYEEKMVVDD